MLWSLSCYVICATTSTLSCGMVDAHHLSGLLLGEATFQPETYNKWGGRFRNVLPKTHIQHDIWNLRRTQAVTLNLDHYERLTKKRTFYAFKLESMSTSSAAPCWLCLSSLCFLSALPATRSFPPRVVSLPINPLLRKTLDLPSKSLLVLSTD